MSDQIQIRARVFVLFLGLLTAVFQIPMISCGGGSANLSGGQGADTTTISNEDSPIATTNLLPDIEELEDSSYVLTCPDGRNGDPDADFLVVTCTGLSGSAGKEYSCAAGVVQSRDEGATDDPTALFEEVRITCDNNSGTGVVTEEELEVI